jgi:hypothetical protein
LMLYILIVAKDLLELVLFFHCLDENHSLTLTLLETNDRVQCDFY